jgi:Macrocin-O-methyltransferase (TylF)
MLPSPLRVSLNDERESHRSHFTKKPLSIRLMRMMARVIPGNRLRNYFYLGLIAAPRNLIRQYLLGFYRIELVYSALREAKRLCDGRLTILEFGTAQGYAFTKMLYAIRYLSMEDCVIAHAFDSFEGMPPPSHQGDRDLVGDDTWYEGQFGGGYDELRAYCQHNYRRTHAIHKGFFETTITPAFLNTLKNEPPILIWIDCDFYSSTRVVFERLLPYIPSGCIAYFDDYELLNFGSRFTGEARLVAEINGGLFGENIELVLDKKLTFDSSRVYRFVRTCEGPRYKLRKGIRSTDTTNRRLDESNDSLLP